MNNRRGSGCGCIAMSSPSPLESIERSTPKEERSTSPTLQISLITQRYLYGAIALALVSAKMETLLKPLVRSTYLILETRSVGRNSSKAMPKRWSGQHLREYE